MIVPLAQPGIVRGFSGLNPRTQGWLALFRSFSAHGSQQPPAQINQSTRNCCNGEVFRDASRTSSLPAFENGFFGRSLLRSTKQ
jgi:hypothetical protein